MSPLALALALAVLLLLLQGGVSGLARLLGRRLWRGAILAGFALPLALLAPWFARERVLAPTATLHIPGAPEAEDKGPHRELSDAVLQFLPWELDVRHALAAGRLPFWSDLADGGSSPWANPQAGVLSPLAMLARALPIQYFLLALLAFKMLVALEGAALLARACGARKHWALFAGVAFALGGGIQAWGLFPHTRVAAWIPWLALGALTCMRRPRPGAVAATALVMAAMLLEGHPETALAGGLFAAATALALRPRRRPWRTTLLGGTGRAAAAAFLGLALAAPQVLPFLAALPGSSRAVETLAELDRTAALRWDDPHSWFYQRRGAFLLAPLARDVFGFPYARPASGGAISWPDSLTAYAGMVAFAGALAALFARRRPALPFLALALGGLLLAAEPQPLMRLLWALPPLRAPAYARLLLPVSLALAVAGALGLQSLASRGRGAVWGSVVAAGLAITAAPTLANAALWLLLLALAFAMTRSAARWQPALAATWLVLALVDLFPWARAGLPAGPPAIFYPPTAALERVADEAAAPGGPWRVAGEDFLFYPNLPAVYGLADPRAHNPMAPAAQLAVLGAAFDFAPLRERYFAPLHHPEHPLLDFLNVRLVLSSRYRPPLPGFERLPEEFDPFVLWRNPEALPRWFLASGAEEVAPEQLASWIAGMRDPRRVALAPGMRARLGCAEIVPAQATVDARRAIPGRIELALPEGVAPCAVLATSIPYAAGWRVSVDGAPRPALVVNGAYLGAAPAGGRRIELRYLPPGLRSGTALCALAVGLLAVLLRRGSGRAREARR